MNAAKRPRDDMPNDYPHTRVVMVVVVIMVFTATVVVISEDVVLKECSTIFTLMAPKVKTEKDNCK